jgi:hypothetical protein
MDEADGVLLGMCVAVLAVITLMHSRMIAKLRDDVEFSLIVARETEAR